MIRYTALCKILECGSFTKAAEALGYTQAAVSQMISSLENEFSVKLLIRTRSGVRLTPEGQQLYPFILKTVSNARELANKVNEINGLVSGEVRLGMFSSLSQHVLPALLKEFGAVYPDINFVLYGGDNKTLPELVRSGAIDCAFIYPCAAHGLKCKRLIREKFLALVPENHRLATEDVLPLKEMAKEKLIIVEEGGDINTILDAFSEIGQTPDVRFRIQDDSTIMAMVEKGFGVSMLSAMTLEHSTYRFKKMITDPPVEREIGVAYADPATLSAATRRFLEFTYQHLGALLSEEYVQML